MAFRCWGVLLFAALLLSPGQGIAIESGPSNTVGFWKFDVHHGFTQVSFPLLPDDKSLNNVLADQLTGGLTPEESDQVLRWDAANARFQTAWYNTSTSSWGGDFTELSEAESYWIYVQPDHPATQTIVAYGNVYEEAVYSMGIIAPGYNAIGSVWAVPAPISQAGMDGFTGGLYLFLSDLIMSYDAATGDYAYAWMDEGGLWLGNLTEFEPLKGYWIYIAPGHFGFEWPNYPQPNPMSLNGETPPPTYPSVLSTGRQGFRIPPAASPPIPTRSVLKKGRDMPTDPAPASANSAKGGAR